MSGRAILRKCLRKGITLRVDGDRLRFRPASAVTPELLDGLKAHKAELFQILFWMDYETQKMVLNSLWFHEGIDGSCLNDDEWEKFTIYVLAASEGEPTHEDAIRAWKKIERQGGFKCQ